MVFGDFEVFAYDWLVVLKDMKNKTVTKIHNDVAALTKFYEEHKNDIWINHNIKHYDQYILKGILLGMNPKVINDKIIVDKMEGWQISKAFREIPLIMYDTMPSVPVGLKTYEGFMGSNIKETDVDFNLDRPLTPEEIEMTFKYCEHDVDEDIKVFLQKKSDFEAMMGIVKIFGLSLDHIGDTEARITATVLDCVKTKFDDEFEYYFLPCVQLKKYKHVMDWFDRAVEDAEKEMDELLKKNPKDKWKYDKNNYEAFKKYFYSRSLTVNVAGVPHTFGFGGLHGAVDKPIHRKGQILHVDVGSYYPSMLIAWDLVTRASRHPEKYKGIYDTRMELKRQGKKKEQAPYKKMLNALSGVMKDIASPAYDPRNNNIMCINGQLMLLDLLEHLEAVPGMEVIQSNTDGLIIMIPDTDEAFNQVDDICYEWEQRCSTEQCSILLELDTIKEIYQKDVNNYIWMSPDGKVGERKGAYVKELSPLDYDLPIINKALVNFFSKGVPVEKTINDCNSLIEFQKIVKLSSKYNHVEHEHCTPRAVTTGVRVKKTHYVYDKTDKHSYKCYRVFASQKSEHGRILKCKIGKKPEKFANTPDHCFIENGDVNGVECPWYLDKQYYINLAKERLKQYGVSINGTV